MNFFVIGGDIRLIHCATSLIKKGHTVEIAGFKEEYAKDFFINECLKSGIEKADALVLPIPITYDNVTLNAPFSPRKIYLEEIHDNISENTIIFGGMIKDSIKEKLNSKRIYDYGKYEDFILKNAVITAEGAFDIIFSETERSVLESNFLITGYGRIGKIMAKIASSFGAEVTVAARKDSDLTLARLNGAAPLKYKNLKKEVEKFDIIVNTVPYHIFTDEIIENMSRNAFFLDLASLPGGCDIKKVNEKGIKGIHALSLPGKTAPISSGEIISDTLFNMTDKD